MMKRNMRKQNRVVNGDCARMYCSIRWSLNCCRPMKPRNTRWSGRGFCEVVLGAADGAGIQAGDVDQLRCISEGELF